MSGFAAPSLAQPECGEVITGPVTLTEDMSCGTVSEVTGALVLDGPDASVDLAGHTIHCEDVIIYGVWMKGEGAQVYGGKIENCSRAVYMAGEGGHEAHDIEMTGRDSARALHIVQGSDYNSVSNIYQIGGFIGLWVESDGNDIRDSVFNHNAFLGGLVAGSGNLLDSNRFQHNESSGLELETGESAGDHNILIFNRFVDNEVDGLRLRVDARNNTMYGNHSLYNGGHGFLVQSFGNTLEANQSILNDEDGIHLDIRAHQTLIRHNASLWNEGVDLYDHREDCFSNEWVSNNHQSSNHPCAQ